MHVDDPLNQESSRGVLDLAFELYACKVIRLDSKLFLLFSQVEKDRGSIFGVHLGVSHVHLVDKHHLSSPLLVVGFNSGLEEFTHCCQFLVVLIVLLVGSLAG